jgi:hypothetical protein
VAGQRPHRGQVGQRDHESREQGEGGNPLRPVEPAHQCETDVGVESETALEYRGKGSGGGVQQRAGDQTQRHSTEHEQDADQHHGTARAKIDGAGRERAEQQGREQQVIHQPFDSAPDFRTEQTPSFQQMPESDQRRDGQQHA